LKLPAGPSIKFLNVNLDIRKTTMLLYQILLQVELPRSPWAVLSRAVLTVLNMAGQKVINQRLNLTGIALRKP